MKKIILFLPTILLLFCFCKSEKPVPESVNKLVEKKEIETPSGNTIESRFDTPEGFDRIAVSENSFAQYLRKLPLKPAKTDVLLFNKNKKANQSAHAAVIDIDTGNRDLQQCADAVMRLRAEYLFSQKKYDEIHFDFVNGFNADYKTWRSGKRISVKGNEVKWIANNSGSTSYESFRKYLNMVFAYAGTASLEKEMKNIELSEMEIGDVFIQGGSPGHAVIVVDMAENKNTGKKLFMLAQSYMPAQDIHVLKNFNNKKISPWYELNFGEVLNTPEWRFTKNDLKRF
ncbi:MAG: DUF4846 domain-containing protein [Saprospiraceae bacterium]